MSSHAFSRRHLAHTATAAVMAETLESRQLLAANLSIDSVQFVDGAGNPIAMPGVNEQIRVEVNYLAQDLPSVSGYHIQVQVDTAQLPPMPLVNAEPLTAGLNGANGLYTHILGGWYAENGMHSLKVTLDSGGVFFETDEVDNVYEATFTTTPHTDLPQKLLWPMGGAPYKDWSIVNYCDLDPRQNFGQDFNGGVYWGEGHAGIDINLSNFRRMDQGIPVYAAADGFVSMAADGFFDRETAFNSNHANVVRIDHGSGWETVYAHFMQDSVTVQFADAAKAGDVIGYIGSSGNSTDAHLHFALTHNGAVVETMFDPANYWQNPEPYQRDMPHQVLDIGVTDYDPNADAQEYPAFQQSMSATFNDHAYLWYRISHLNKGDVEEVKWFRPGGIQYNTGNDFVVTHTADRRYRFQHWKLSKSVFSQQTGYWTAKVFVNGQELASTQFCSGSPNENVRLRHDGLQVIDGRTTPIDFGTVGQGGYAEKTFVVENKGWQPLLLANLSVPQGFSLAGSFPTSVAAQNTGSFNIRMDSQELGRKFGQLRFHTNDTTYDSEFTFNLTGQVDGTFPSDTPVVRLPRPATAYVWGSGSVLIDPFGSFSQSGATKFEGMALVVEIASGNDAFDWVGIQHEGYDPGQIGVSGTKVLYGGQVIGSTSLGGFASSELRVTFNADATEAAIDKVVKQLKFFNTSWQFLRTHPRYLKVYVTGAEFPDKPLSDVVVQMVVVAHKFGQYPQGDPKFKSRSESVEEETAMREIELRAAVTSETLVQEQVRAVDGDSAAVEMRSSDRLLPQEFPLSSPDLEREYTEDIAAWLPDTTAKRVAIDEITARQVDKAIVEIFSPLVRQMSA